MWRGFNAAQGYRQNRGELREEIDLGAWLGPGARDYRVVEPIVQAVLDLYPHLAFHRVAYPRSHPGSPPQSQHFNINSGPRGQSYFTLIPP
jgi:hypothetical protein